MSGLLVVNADDWGGFAEGTDAILSAFRAGAITSTTAMVFMADSARAADLAAANAVPTGLHLNLTQELDGPVPDPVRARHEVLRAHFADLARRRWRIDPRILRTVAAAVTDQLDEYARLYGAPPTHVDSHHHVHICPDVLLSGGIPRGTRVRQTRSAAVGASPPLPARLARAAKHRAIAGRFVTTDRFWAIDDVHPERGGAGFAAATAVAAQRPVEVMCHPSFPGELEQLLREDWVAFVRSAPCGSYAALR